MAWYPTGVMLTDVVLCRLAHSAAKHLGITVAELIEAVGFYFVQFAFEQGYSKLLRALGHNIVEFLINLNSLHLHLNVGWPSMRPPMFAVEQVGHGRSWA